MQIRSLASSGKLSRSLFEQLAEEIKSGRLAPGDRLPTELALTRAAQVSRTVVREAVAALRAEGLVITRQGVGAFVSAEAQRAPFRIEPDRLRSLADILNVMELRVGVEVESAGLAAIRATRSQLSAIDKALSAMEAASKEAGNTDVTARVPPDLNHIFVHDTDGFPKNYAKLPPPVMMETSVVKIITDWLAQRLR